MNLDDVMATCRMALENLEPLFSDKAQLTLIVRLPREMDADIVVTKDNMTAVMGAVARLRDREFKELNLPSAEVADFLARVQTGERAVLSNGNASGELWRQEWSYDCGQFWYQLIGPIGRTVGPLTLEIIRRVPV
jgi:hypothetical protein